MRWGFPRGAKSSPWVAVRANLVRAGEIHIGINTPSLGAGIFIFTALAELSTRQIAASVDATGMDENKDASKKGGGIAKKAKLALEEKTKKKVVSKQSYLEPALEDTPEE